MIADDVLREEMARWESIGLSGGGGMFTPAISPHDPKLIIVNCDMSCAFRSTDGGETWEMFHHQYLMGNTRCRPVFHPIDPDVVYAAHGYPGELRISRDRGATWEPLGEGLPAGLNELAIDASDGSFLLVGAWEGTFFSTDGGDNWQRSTGIDGEIVGFHIDQTSSTGGRRCFAGTREGVFVSEDAGANWQQIGEGLPDKELLDFAGGSDAENNDIVLYCTTEGEAADGQYVGGIYRSTDRGRTWQQAMGADIDTRARERWGRKFAPQYQFVLTTNVKPLTVYACRARSNQVYRSDDGGETWRPTFFSETDSAEFNLEPNYLTAELGSSEMNLSGAGINPADTEMVITTDWMCCQITRDGGKNWETLHTRPAAGQAEVAKGHRWENTGLVVTTVWHYYIDPFEKNRHYMAYTDIKFARSEDAGKTWYSQWDKPLRNTTYELAFDSETPGKIWGAFADLHDIPNNNVISGKHYWPRAGGGVGLSEDFGKTWRDSSDGLPNKPVVSVVLDPRSPKDTRVLYASLFEAGVYKSTDDGKTWVKKSDGLGAPDTNERACRLILHDDGTLFCLVTALRKDDRYVREGPGLYRSRDGGESWECINSSQPLLWPKDFDIDPRDSNVIYLGAADANNREGGLYKTTDGGETWKRVSRESHEVFGATVHPKRPDWVYMCLCEGAPSHGLWLSKDGGESWEPFIGIPFRNIQRVSFDPDDDSIIYVCTFGGSVWKGPAEP
jgi:photosystem II stability/assembly factor-like uncharacterized protein